jgi:uncharacterized protein
VTGSTLNSDTTRISQAAARYAPTVPDGSAELGCAPESRNADISRIPGSFATLAGAGLFGELPAEVGHGTINDSAERAQIQVDVAVFAAPAPDSPRRILSLGEAKWGEVMGLRHLTRLARARDLLAAKKYDTSTTVLACYSAVGFDQDLRDQAARASRNVLLIGPEELYAP